MEKRVALYAGSFDPYTNGHHAVVKKAAALFDEVVVLIGVNIGKKRAFDDEALTLYEYSPSKTVIRIKEDSHTFVYKNR